MAVPRHQHQIVTIFGLFRDICGAIPIATLIRMMADLGVERNSVRSSVSRLKKRNVLVSDKVDGAAAYTLSPHLVEVFEEGDRRIFGRHTEASDEWLLATFTVPESHRNLRHRIRILLGRWGFGSVAPGLWIAPIGVAAAVRARLRREDLDGYVEFFTARYLDTAELRDKVARWWDLQDLEEHYRCFVDRHAGLATDVELPPEVAFAHYIPLVTDWRQLPYLDPGLPGTLLPVGWSGGTAEDLFMTAHRRLSGPSRQYAQQLLAGR